MGLRVLIRGKQFQNYRGKPWIKETFYFFELYIHKQNNQLKVVSQVCFLEVVYNNDNYAEKRFTFTELFVTTTQMKR